MNNHSSPIVVYENCDRDKSLLFNDNRNKSLVYRWVNKINGKSYVGSTTSFANRFYKYYSLKHLETYRTSIHNALVKYGYANFKLEVLEYCDKNNITSREQFYIDNINPEYNILKFAYSNIGYKHTVETILKMRHTRSKISEETKAILAEKARGRIHTDITRLKISNKHTGKILSDVTKKKISKYITSVKGVPVVIINTKLGTQTEFVNLTEAAKSIKVSRPAIAKALKSGKYIKNTYKIIKK